jgi:hypothetical protein
MPTFAIDRDNSIRLLGPDEKPFITETPLSTLDELVGVSVTHNWSKQEVTDVWNKFATTRGLKTQKCFKNRLFGLKRIWDGIQPSNVVETFEKGRRIAQEYQDTPTVAKTQAEVTDHTPGQPAKKTRKPKAPKPPREPRKTAAKAEKNPREPRAGGNTKVRAIEMLKRKDGATAAEIGERLGWSVSSVAMLVQWLKLVTTTGVTSITVEKNSKGERVYKAA